MELGDDGLESLVQTTSFIPCSGINKSSRKGKQKSSDITSHLPRLPKYESKDGAAATLRTKGFEQAKWKVQRCFEASLQDFYAPLLDKLQRCITNSTPEAQNPFFIPNEASAGPSGSSREEERLSCVGMIGPPLHSSFPSRLSSTLSPSARLVVLPPSDCISLPSALKLLVTRSLFSPCGATLLDPKDDKIDLNHLLKLSDSPITTLVVSFANSPAWSHAVLNDVIIALFSFSQLSKSQHRVPLKIVILLHSQSGFRALQDCLHPDTLKLLGLQNFTFPSARQAFERVIEEIYIGNPQHACPIIFGRKTLDFLRRRIFEDGGDLDDVYGSMELMLHHHFSSNPLSALITTDEHLSPLSWSRSFFDRLRCEICEETGKGNAVHRLSDAVQLPAPLADNDKLTMVQHLQKMMTDDDYLLRQLPAFTKAQHERWKQRGRLLRLLRLVEGGLRWVRDGVMMEGEEEKDGSDPTKGRNATNRADESDLLELGPHQTSLAGLITKLVAEEDRLEESYLPLSMYLSRLVTSLRRLEVDKYEHFLIFLIHRIHNMTPNSSSYDALSGGEREGQTIERLESDLKALRHNYKDVDSVEEESKAQDESTRVENVQQQLLKQERFEEFKQESVKSLMTPIQTLLQLNDGTLPLMSAFLYNSTLHISHLLEPNPRAHLLAALSNPSIYISSGSKDKGMTDVVNGEEEKEEDEERHRSHPDIVNAYLLYRSAGKLLNLADWYSVFQQRVDFENERKESDSSGPTKKRKRGQENDREEEKNKEGEGWLEKEKGWKSKEMVQTRFAICVNELAKMGFLKRTRRKPEHVLKCIWDLEMG